MNMPELEEEQTKKITDWVLINKFAFNRLKNDIDNAVTNKKDPKIGKKRPTYVYLQDFLQDIINRIFNNAKEAKDFYFFTKN